jgi:hypothetical protein
MAVKDRPGRVQLDQKPQYSYQRKDKRQQEKGDGQIKGLFKQSVEGRLEVVVDLQKKKLLYEQVEEFGIREGDTLDFGND